MISIVHLGGVMQFTFAPIAVMLCLCGSVGAIAQTAAQIGGPREVPPASYEGQQYVDSRGCVFLRAGFGGAVNWVPRVDADRKVICGLPPTFGPQEPIEVAEEVQVPAAPAVVEPAAPAPAPALAPALAAAVVVLAQPAQTVRAAAPLASPLPLAVAGVAAPVVQPAPYATVAPANSYQVVASGPGPGKIGCYKSAPVAEVVRLSNGGTAVVCTRGDGGLSGWRPPIYPDGRGVGAALSYPTRAAASPAVIAPGTAATAVAAAATIPTPPKGYRLAWADDRLNPMRGVGTAAGQAQQDRVWTREVPARQVVVAAAPLVPTQVQAQTRTSTKTRPAEAIAETATQAAANPSYVQVGSFAVPANADGAAARLKALGLPVAKAQMTSGGKALQVIYAGPFASAAAASQALSLARGAGFGDAFIR